LGITWKEYKLLDGSMQSLVQRVGDGNIIERFDKTPYPKELNDVVCPHFLELKWAWGCPYDCSWCYLKGTFRFFKDKKTGRILPSFKARTRVESACRSFKERVQTGHILNSGELADSLMDEASTTRNKGVAFSKFIIEVFKDSPHKVLFLSKGIQVTNFVENSWQKNAILSWSINDPEVAKIWEKGAPDPVDRLKAAKIVQDCGYEVRLRLDPMVPVEGWQQKYKAIIDKIFKIGLEPERITLGTLRGLLSTLANVSNGSWTKYLDTKNYTSWGYKPDDSIRLELYQNAMQHLEDYGFKSIGMCKETVKIWQMLGLSFKEIICNCINKEVLIGRDLNDEPVQPWAEISAPATYPLPPPPVTRKEAEKDEENTKKEK